MTTIATDGITIAADGQTLAGWEIINRTTKKILVKDHVIFAVSGLHGLLAPLAAWWLAGCDPNKLPPCTPGDDGWNLLVIDKDEQGNVRTQLLSHRVPHPYPVPPVFTLGSGADFARMAMLMGADARTAVARAMEIDAGSGGEILSFNIAKALGLAPELALVAAE